MRHFHRMLLGGLAALSFTSTVYADAFQDRMDGLQPVDSKRLTRLYVNPDAGISAYRQVLLDEAPVSFERGWLRQQLNAGLRISEADQEQLRADLAGQLRDVFSEHFTSRGFELVDEPGPGVLRVSPALVDVNLFAPDIGRNQYSTVRGDSAGQMTLEISYEDAQTGQLLAGARDQKLDRSPSFTIRNAQTNRRAIDDMLKQWAEALEAELGLRPASPQR